MIAIKITTYRCAMWIRYCYRRIWFVWMSEARSLFHFRTDSEDKKKHNLRIFICFLGYRKVIFPPLKNTTIICLACSKKHCGFS